jgi:hypothetical protein
VAAFMQKLGHVFHFDFPRASFVFRGIPFTVASQLWRAGYIHVLLVGNTDVWQLVIFSDFFLFMKPY